MPNFDHKPPMDQYWHEYTGADVTELELWSAYNMVYDALKGQMGGALHALALKTKAPS